MNKAPVRLLYAQTAFARTSAAIRPSCISHNPRSHIRTATAMTPARSIHLCLDFDTTLTKSDTLLPLSEIGYFHPHSVPPRPWSEIVSAYLTCYKLHATNYPHPPASRKTLAQEAAWLSSLAGVERESFERAVEAGVWDDVTGEEILAEAGRMVMEGKVELRTGWKRVVERALGIGDYQGLEGKVSVVSVNWSRTWLWGCIRADWARQVEMKVTGEKSKQDEQVDVPANIAIYANELPSLEAASQGVQMVDRVARDISGNIHAPNELPKGQSRRLHTAEDKLRCFRALISDHTASWTSHRRRHEHAAQGTALPVIVPLSVYIGDSIGDLLCLVDADVGICLRDEPMGGGMKELVDVSARLNIDLSWIGEFNWVRDGQSTMKIDGQSWDTDWKRKLWFAKDFSDVEKWLLSRPP